MDSLDRRILNQLQLDAGMTNQALADAIGLSPSACLKRVNRLRAAGIIDREVALLNPNALGQCLHMVVEVTMERDNKALYQRFLNSALSAPEVKQCYQVTGESDFILIMIVKDLDEYDRFCDQVLYSDDNMRKFRTLLSRKRHKFDISLPLGD
ncbi:MAG: Lrp/AsnC family transcriptional regulator [Halomonadaceae bacterium]|uniref:Lrp/AsnC family transcriptional regulator n=1 Tax=Halomonas colorata TaxID=2742615 RepID=A0ABR9FTU2_9GAMM|nr:Lrp/AsnC family transcriptional regulator [Halomonas colorata]MBE0462060.1 Lrp/AsnC family transcriptional regulator [Halomonas colorata]